MPTGGSFTPVGVALNTPVITTSPDANLTNEQALSPLGTGILKVATGTLSVAVGADLPSHNHTAAEISSALASPPAIGGTTPAAVTGTIGVFGTSIKTPIVFPPSDGTAALKINKADGTTNVLTVDTTNGRLGIGTVSPAGRLEVNAAASSSVPIFRATDGTVNASFYIGSTEPKAQWGTETANDLAFYTNNVTRMRMFSSGGIAIGTSPTSDPGAANLTVVGTLTTNAFNQINGAATLKNLIVNAGSTSPPNVAFSNLKTTGSTPILNLYNGSDALVASFLSTGFLGIGVTPTVPFEIQAGSTQGGAFSTGTSTSPRFIGFAVTGSGTCDLLFNTYLNNVNALVASKLGAGGTLEFSTGGTLTYYASASVAADANRTFATVFHIDSTGKFGIGNGQSPLSILHPITTDTASGAVTNGITLERTSSGTPSAGYGTNFRFLLKSSTTAQRLAATIKALWNVETDASRAPDLVITASDANAEREIMRGRATGSAPAIAFLGATPAVQQTGGAATATGTWTATEQSMLQKAYDALRTFGLLN